MRIIVSMNTQDMWTTALSFIEKEISKPNFQTWFKDTCIVKIEDGVVNIGVPNAFVEEWLANKFNQLILKTLRENFEGIHSLKYVVIKGDMRRHLDDKVPESKRSQELPLHDHYVNKEDNLNPRYTFDTFIIGSFNELAHAAAQAVIKNPGIGYNPFFIHGNTGHGKTHLIQAIGNEIKKKNPEKRIYYITSEKFGQDYVKALQTNKIAEFKEKYRKYDVLIMDDIQFFSSKEKMQEELFHLFNAFHDSNKQIVFSSDKHPNFIPGLESRLISRFGSGMIVDIPIPDHESRMAIIKSKAQLRGYNLHPDVIDFLATYIASNIREIEGVLNTIFIQTDLKDRVLSLNEVRELVRNSARPKKIVSVKDVVKTISEYYGINEESIYEKTRKKEIIKPRQVIMYILREDFNISFPSIGQKLGGRDHTTVIHSCEKIKVDIKKDPSLTQELDQIRGILTNIM
ncbi:MAG: chromosomal replication initiator protein DnaA [Candidatus Zambryskibacteria bacterium CG10_big_fil_rev_8_21_14_0_10_42_12]|uniref:Chromosomal replication initiator protein DnaA n=1 Tax=Candidatus Zambryskibacteria bacterium CG10_big_fil_rev_8_21_14_0_10_42_12 TaxID=1975115 RepID=A0A2H0QSN9_9BACT|nr:MAG: chromosomal replication initiator protein DnaA [Candidatus Zambryskibacteria bacterium CG10_big_fil_rev_8_21_14_0_10_42_12]